MRRWWVREGGIRKLLLLEKDRSREKSPGETKFQEYILWGYEIFDLVEYNILTYF